MSRVVLTDKRLAALKPAQSGKRYDVIDALVPNLAVRVTDTGSKAFIFRTRFPGRPFASRRVLGKVGALSVERARVLARKWHELLGLGVDPRWQAEQDRLALQRAQQHSFKSVAEAYFAYIQRQRLRKAKAMEREIRKEFVTRWAARPIHDIGPRDLAAVIEALVKRGSPSQAHTMFGRARSLWRWAINSGAYGLEDAPTDRLAAKALIGAKRSRSRILSDPELQALWQALEQEQYPWQPLYRLLLWTGQRLSDVANAHWSEFDLERRLWTIPAERYKTQNPQVVPLTNDMLALLARLPRFDSGDFVLSASWGKRPVQNFAKPKRRLDARMRAALPQLPDWVVHDIRRTVRSHLSALPVEQHVRELVIGHAQKGLHAVYDRYAYIEEKRAALELWRARLRAIVEPPDNVTRLKPRARKA